MNLEKAITESVSKLKEEGFIEELVKKELENSISKVLNNCLSTYSDFGKNLEKSIEKKLQINFDNLDIPEYNTLVGGWVKEIVNKQINLTGKEKIEKDLEKFFQPLEKTHWKLSEIIEKFRDEVFDAYNDKYEESFFLEITESDSCTGYIDIYFDKDKTKYNKFSCDYAIDLKPTEDKKNHVLWNLKVDGNSIDKNTKYKPCLFGFDAFLFQLYCSNVTIENDIEDVEDHNYVCGD